MENPQERAPVATPSDVEKRLGRELDDDEALVVDGLLEEAEILIEGCLGAIPSPVPRRVVVVALSLIHI